jgi:hypothetical protein
MSRVTIIYAGAATLVVGLVFALISIASVSSAKDDKKAAEQAESAVGLSNLTDTYMGDPEAEAENAEMAKSVDEAQDEIEDWQTRRNWGLAAAGVGAVVFAIGLATPKTQQVEIVGGTSGEPRHVNPAKNGDVSERLATLRRLNDEGVLTEGEYERERQRIIGSI